MSFSTNLTGGSFDGGRGNNCAVDFRNAPGDCRKQQSADKDHQQVVAGASLLGFFFRDDLAHGSQSCPSGRFVATLLGEMPGTRLGSASGRLAAKPALPKLPS